MDGGHYNSSASPLKGLPYFISQLLHIQTRSLHVKTFNFRVENASIFVILFAGLEFHPESIYRTLSIDV